MRSNTIDHELLDAVLQGGLGDPRVALRPVIAATCDQPYPIAVTFDADAETVMLDFVKPLWPGRHLDCVGRQAELKRNMVLLKATSTAPPAVVRSQGEAVPGSLLLGGVTRQTNCGGSGWFPRKKRPRMRGGGIAVATNPTGPSFLPGIYWGRDPGERVIKLSVPPFVPNAGFVGVIVVVCNLKSRRSSHEGF